MADNYHCLLCDKSIVGDQDCLDLTVELEFESIEVKTHINCAMRLLGELSYCVAEFMTDITVEEEPQERKKDYFDNFID